MLVRKPQQSLQGKLPGKRLSGFLGPGTFCCRFAFDLYKDTHKICIYKHMRDNIYHLFTI